MKSTVKKNPLNERLKMNFILWVCQKNNKKFQLVGYAVQSTPDQYKFKDLVKVCWQSSFDRLFNLGDLKYKDAKVVQLRRRDNNQLLCEWKNGKRVKMEIPAFKYCTYFTRAEFDAVANPT